MFFLVAGLIGLLILGLALIVGDVIDGVFHVDFLDNDLFSTASIGGFIGAFGFGGLIASSFVPGLLVPMIVGVLAGALAAWGAAALTRWLRRGEHQGAFHSSSMVGSAGRVITAIPEGGYGEVLVFVGGSSKKRSARANEAIPAGTEVWVSDIVSPTAVEVTRAHPADPEPMAPLDPPPAL